MMRTYGQYCGLAHALDLIGARWSLMIVRELLLGPRRFTDLEQGLSGIPTNILSARLREMEEFGLVERNLLPRPANAVVYALTEYGRELEGPLQSLGLWGAKSLGQPTEDDVFSLGASAMALKAAFRPEAAEGQEFLYELRIDDQPITVAVSNGQVSFPQDPNDEPDAVIATDPVVFAEVFGGHRSVESAIEASHVQIQGPQHEAIRFFEIFRLPSHEPDSR